MFYVGAVPTLCILNVGTIPMFRILNVGTVPTLCILNVGTVPTFILSELGHLNDLHFLSLPQGPPQWVPMCQDLLGLILGQY